MIVRTLDTEIGGQHIRDRFQRIYLEHSTSKGPLTHTEPRSGSDRVTRVTTHAKIDVSTNSARTLRLPAGIGYQESVGKLKKTLGLG